MAPVKTRRYEFNAKSIAEVRTRMKMKQTTMAELLGVPANTLSRWETGATTPDANSLAAIYSIAQDNGQEVNFFESSATPEPAPRKGLRVAVFADFQNIAVSAKDIPKLNNYIRDEVKSLFPNTVRTRFRAFGSSKQAIRTWGQKGWRVKEGKGNMDDAIIQQAKAYCEVKPKETALVLMTKDGDFSGLVKDLQAKGVQVWLLSPPNPSKKLLDAVGKKHRIGWMS